MQDSAPTCTMSYLTYNLCGKICTYLFILNNYSQTPKLWIKYASIFSFHTYLQPTNRTTHNTIRNTPLQVIRNATARHGAQPTMRQLSQNFNNHPQSSSPLPPSHPSEEPLDDVEDEDVFGGEPFEEATRSPRHGTSVTWDAEDRPGEALDPSGSNDGPSGRLGRNGVGGSGAEEDEI